MQWLILKQVIAKQTLVNFEADPGRFSLYLGDSAARASAEEHHRFFYWRMVGREGHDLFSLDIDQTTGEVFTISLLAYHRSIIALSESDSCPSLDTGTPVFDFCHCKPTGYVGFRDSGSSLVDVKEDFLIQVGQNRLRVLLFADQVGRHIKVDGRLTMEFNQNSELAGILISDLTPEEKRLICY